MQAAATLVGGPATLLAVRGLLQGDVTGDGKPDAVVRACSETQDACPGHVLSGALLPNGVDDIAATLVAQVPETWYTQDAAYAGDLDGDGFGDLWLHGRAFLGPLAGEYTGADAWADLPWVGLDAVLGNIDVDDDGDVDVALASDYEELYVFYGPWVDGMPADLTTVDNHDLCNDRRVFFLGPLNSEEQRVFSVGWGWDDSCEPNNWFIDLAGRRGEQEIQINFDAFAWMDESLWTYGQLDQDPLTDVFDVNLGAVLGEPLLGEVENDYGTLSGPYQNLEFVGNGSVPLLCDFTGDGLDDFVVFEYVGDTSTGHWGAWVHASPLTGDVVATTGVELVAPEWTPSGYLTHCGDLTGDGVADVVTSWVDSSDLHGEIRVFSGAEIAAELEATEPALPPGP